MRIVVLLAAILLLAGCGTRADVGGRPETASIRGVYAVDRGNGWGCTLEAEPVEGGRLHFALDCNRGPPSYNMGYAEGVIPLSGTEAVYRVDEFGGCEIRFRFDGERVHVKETSELGGCGFGYGVYADGTYLRFPGEPQFLPYPDPTATVP